MVNPKAKEALLAYDDQPMIAAQQAKVSAITVTATSGDLPTANSAITVADTTTPTVVELLEYCTELKAQVDAMNAVLEAHGLSADA